MLVETLFHKPINELKEADLVQFFGVPQTETDKIEFKCFKEVEFPAEDFLGQKPLKNNDVLKKIINTICAFLNTDGGVLIWGAPEGKIVQKSKEKTFSGSLTPIGELFEKDQVISRIATAINPTPNRIYFTAIATASGHVYVFEAEKSEFSPHQVTGTYYMRLDGQTRFAPHQYVEALMRKVKLPKLHMQFTFGEPFRTGDVVCLPICITIHNSVKYTNEKNVFLNLTSFAHVFPEKSSFVSPSEGTDLTLKIADVLYPGMPVRRYFFLVTTMNFGAGRRTIPVNAVLAGEYSPVSRLTIDAIFDFTHELQVSFEPAGDAVNRELQDDGILPESLHHDIQMRHWQQTLIENGEWQRMKEWRS